MKKVFLENLPRLKNNKINWKNSIGYIVKFIYDDLEGEFEIIKYINDKSRRKLGLNYNNTYNEIPVDMFYYSTIGRLLNKYSREYKYEVGDIIEGKFSKIKIINKIKMEHLNKLSENSKIKAYKYECLQCGNIDQISESNLNNGKGCNICCGNPRKVLKGINDMWTTNPNLARLLENVEDGFKYTEFSTKRLHWKCLNCDNIIKDKKICSINLRGLSCPQCSDGISYPEKIMSSMLNQLNCNYIIQLSQKNFEWCDKFRYDYYISSVNCIIETHGLQHYENYNRHWNNLQYEQENDRIKERLAKQNGIEHYIVIDCRYSELKYIKNNILNSNLSQLFDLSNIDWIKCSEYACSSLVKKACDLWNSGLTTGEIGKVLNLDSTTIGKYLKQGNNANWCDYDGIKGKERSRVMAKESIIKTIGKKVICLNTKEIFNTITEAEIKYKTENIAYCCKNKRNYSGKHPITNEPLVWMYYDDYLNKGEKVIKNTKYIICLNTNETFEMIKDASKKYNIHAGCISECCQGKLKSAGKHPETGEKMRWMYYDEYIKTIENNEINVLNNSEVK